MSCSDEGFLSVDYEIHGNVQNVFFRQHTYEEAGKLGVVGWVMNTEKGTVKGTIQGTEEQIHNIYGFNGNDSTAVIKSEQQTVVSVLVQADSDILIRKWFLANKGSPYCRIDRAVFTNERRVGHKEFKRFTISYGDWR